MNSKRVAIVQSNYIPWKGYFDMINSVDEFILYDDAQYTRRDWRNRNRIKTHHGIKWLTIPVEVSGKYYQKIRDTRISDPRWRLRHWEAIRHSYALATYFREYAELFDELYLNCTSIYLSEINRRFIDAICSVLGIHTRISRSSDYELTEGRSERLVSLCKQACADYYISGPSARGYLDERLFVQHGIMISYMDYSGYPEYPQLYPPFEHAVSIIDLIFNTGSRAPRCMKSFGSGGQARAEQ